MDVTAIVWPLTRRPLLSFTAGERRCVFYRPSMSCFFFVIFCLFLGLSFYLFFFFFTFEIFIFVCMNNSEAFSVPQQQQQQQQGKPPASDARPLECLPVVVVVVVVVAVVAVVVDGVGFVYFRFGRRLRVTALDSSRANGRPLRFMIHSADVWPEVLPSFTEFSCSFFFSTDVRLCHVCRAKRCRFFNKAMVLFPFSFKGNVRYRVSNSFRIFLERFLY